jgi:hypothetical protein
MALIFGTSLSMASASETLDAAALQDLVSSKTWKIKIRHRDMFWDWKSDGSVCARIAGAARTEDCADEGKWNLRKNVLCWKLSWLYLGDGNKVGDRCAYIRGANNEYEVLREEPDGTPASQPLFEFSLVD